MNQSAQAFNAARDFLLSHRDDYDTAYRDFRWPELDEFNWALDYFDALRRASRRPAGAVDRRARTAGGANCTLRRAVRRVEPGRQLAARAGRQARRPRAADARQRRCGCGRSMLAAMKLGAVIIPATTLLDAGRPARPARPRPASGTSSPVASDAGKFDDVAGDYTRIAVGDAGRGLAATTPTPPRHSSPFTPDGADPGRRPAAALLHLRHHRASRSWSSTPTRRYPVGHLSTMYWIGLQPGDVHLNISSPGLGQARLELRLRAVDRRGDRASSSTSARFDARGAARRAATAAASRRFCAPPTVWRMLIQDDLAAARIPLREVVGAGEPLNPEVIEQVAAGLGADDPRRLRPDRDDRADRQLARPAGQARLDGPAAARATRSCWSTRRPGSARRRGRDLPRPRPDRPLGPDGRLPRRRRAQRRGDGAAAATTPATSARATPTATSPTSAAPTTCSRPRDYRISPFELESVLIEHPAVAEAAVVPSPDPLRLAVPKAYVVLAAGLRAGRRRPRGRSSRYAREHLAPYKRIRRLEFAELPKTISGKIRRVELRGRENELHSDASATPPGEFTL